MAYIRNSDIKVVGKKCVVKDRIGASLTEIKYGCNSKVKRKVPTFNTRGKLLTRPKK